MFDKFLERFPSKEHVVSFNHCGVSPTCQDAVKAQKEVTELLGHYGSAAYPKMAESLKKFRTSAGKLLLTSPENISFISNCAQGLNAVANGLPLTAGDEIISYRYEYPSNHFPWQIQERKGVVLKLCQGTSFEGKPLGFSVEEIESLVSTRTKVIALSHVQFASGFACDLKAIGEICRARGIYFIVDAAQSLGCIPVYPEILGIDALVASGWKWLLGPVGSGLLFTSPSLRRNIVPTEGGSDMMRQGDNFLDYTWNPFSDGRLFEYSSISPVLRIGLGAALELFNSVTVESIWAEIQRLQNIFLDNLTSTSLTRAPLNKENRSGILSFHTSNPEKVVAELKLHGFVTSVRGGYFRIAPHYYLEDIECNRLREELATV